MCLMLTLRTEASSRDRLEEIIRRNPPPGLCVEVGHGARWPWSRKAGIEIWVSEKGGCACSLLADEADWDADTWAMRPEVLEQLGSALSTIAEAAPDGTTVEAIWQGEKADREQRVTPHELGEIARRSQLGTHTRYVVSHSV